MKVTVSLLIDIRYLKKDNTYAVKLAVYFDDKCKRHTLPNKVSMTKEEWDKLNQKWLRNNDLIQKRDYITEEKSRALHIVKELGDNFSFEQFEAIYKGKHINNNQVQLYRLYQEIIDYLSIGHRLGMLNCHKTAMKSIQSFAPKLKLTEITPMFLKNYEQWMLDSGNSITTVGFYLRSLRVIMNIARNRKLITDEMYPFGSGYKGKYEIPRGHNIKKALSTDELKSIINAKCYTKAAEFSRDIWLFSLYCNGMNMDDIFSLKYEDVQDDYILYRRGKTLLTIKEQNPLEVYLSKPALSIIEKWENRDKSRKNYIFAVYTLSMTPEERYRKKYLAMRQINGYMERLAKKLGIHSKVSTIVARHTWATMLKNNGVSVEEISESLGHVNLITTLKYLDSFPKEYHKRNTEKLLDLLK